MSDTELNLLMASSSNTSKCISNALKKQFPEFIIHRVETRLALSQALEEKQWNLLFTEMELADFSANELPELIEAFGLSIPVALIADQGVTNVASRCLEYSMCQLVQCDEPYLRFLPATVSALLKRAEVNRQRQVVEQELIESQERFLDIFNNTSDLIQCVAPDGSFIYTNNAWRKAMGYSREELQLLNLQDVLHPESKHCCQKRFEMLQQGKKLTTIDFKYVTKAGETLHLIGDCGSIIKDGVATSTRGIFRNVTQTVLAERALKESEALYQAMYDLAPDIYTTVNSQGKILSVNQTGLDILGYTREELIGKSVAKVIHPDDQYRVFSHVKSLFNSENDDEGIDYREVTKDGSVIWVHQCVALDKNVDDPRLMVVCRDITVRRELQEKLAFYATHDSLTKLINRRELENRLQRVLSETTQYDSHILCYLDLDEFKIINDANGHPAGDELLRQITTIFQEHIRSRDTLARIGGDEFVILMEHCPLDAAIATAEKLQKVVTEFQFNWRAQMFTISISIGITRLFPGASVGSMLGIADAACYKAKNNGRNCIYVNEEI